MTIFIRLLGSEDKAAELAGAIIAQRAGESAAVVFDVAPASFEQVPGSPFAYWVSEGVRSLFRSLPLFEGEGRTVKQGLATADDFRFVRAWWEVPVGAVRQRWFPFAKGGAYSPFYADVHLLVNWAKDGAEIINFVDTETGKAYSRVQNTEYYFRPGLTWPLRASRFSPQVLPEGCIFSVRGYGILAPLERLPYLLGIGSSSPFDYLFKVLLGRFGYPEFIVGVLQKLPMPEVGQDIQDEIAHLATKAWREKKNMDKAVENSHAFSLPALLQMQGAGIAENSTQWSRRLEEAKAMLDKIQRDIDERCFEDYGFSQNDRAAVASSAVNSIEEEDKSDVDEDVEAEAVEADPSSLAADLIGWLVGAAFGRFDVRLAIAERDVPPESEPFDPLPVCSAGMLTDSHGLPVKRSPDGYPISWPEDGVLLDDPGIGGMVSHRDIVRRVRQVIEIVWREKAADIERELCALLGARELREYLRKHTGFFERHLKRYSKSRRKAPIYWPLSTASGAYTVWVYYPRLTADTVYKIVAEHIGPKIGKVEDRIAQLEGGEAKREGREGARASKELGELAELLAELKEMREELLRVAKLSYKPDLNDGVQITAAPLWRLFRLPRWRSELERTWKALEDEECEWAHLACAIWPERVKEKCKTDKSLAIAHGLEAIYEEPVREDEAERPRRRGKRAGAAQARRGR